MTTPTTATAESRLTVALEALADIAGAGRVCAEFMTCRHASCADSAYSRNRAADTLRMLDSGEAATAELLRLRAAVVTASLALRAAEQEPDAPGWERESIQVRDQWRKRTMALCTAQMAACDALAARLAQ